MKLRLSSVTWVTVGTLWVLSICVGFFLLMAYEFKPGVAAASSKDWPQSSSLRLSGSLQTLVMFVHPQCPCSRASIEQLSELLKNHQETVHTTVVFVAPKVLPQGWNNTELRRQAAGVPGVQIADDIGGKEADLFGAITSGQTFLYGKSGRLLYSGGITRSRGQIGANANFEALLAALNDTNSRIKERAVFGCKLCSQQDEQCHARN